MGEESGTFEGCETQHTFGLEHTPSNLLPTGYKFQRDSFFIVGVAGDCRTGVRYQGCVVTFLETFFETSKNIQSTPCQAGRREFDDEQPNVYSTCAIMNPN